MGQQARHHFGPWLQPTRASNRAGPGGANSGLGQNRAGPKLARIFPAKILVTQPALKTELVGPNSLLKAKKIRAGRAGSGHIGPGLIWPSFFRANNLMASPALIPGGPG